MESAGATGGGPAPLLAAEGSERTNHRRGSSHRAWDASQAPGSRGSRVMPHNQRTEVPFASFDTMYRPGDTSVHGESGNEAAKGATSSCATTARWHQRDQGRAPPLSVVPVVKLSQSSSQKVVSGEDQRENLLYAQ